MEALTYFTYLLSISLLIVSLIKAEKCIQKSSCTCQTTSSNFLVDLRSLSDPSNPSLKAVGSDGYTYVYNPCVPLPKCTDVVNAAAVCQSLNRGAEYCAGTESSAKFDDGDLQGNTLNLKVSYKDPQGTTRSSSINIVCDQNKEGELTYVSTTGTTTDAVYNLQLRTKHACISSSSGLSAGSALLLIFFLLLLTYVITGMLFMKFRRGASGVELVPNLEFWKGLPSLIKDGVVFVSKGCKADTTYTQI